MGLKLLKTVQTITTFRNSLADPVGTRRGPPLVRGPQFENLLDIFYIVNVIYILRFLFTFCLCFNVNVNIFIKCTLNLIISAIL